MSFGHVQGTSFFTAGAAQSAVVTLGSNPVQGNVVAMAALFDSTVDITNLTVVDANSNAYLKTPNSPSGRGTVGARTLVWLLYLIAPSNASKTINLNWTGSIGADIWADEFSVSNGPAVFDKDVGGVNNYTSSTLNLPPITPTHLNSLLYATVFPQSFSITNPTPGATQGGWTGVAGSPGGPNTGGGSEYQLAASGQTFPNFTDGGSPDNGIVVMVMSFALGDTVAEHVTDIQLS